MIPITPTIYQLLGVTKEWTDSVSIFRVLIPDLTITQGEAVAVIGMSGCGKSTLLEMLAMTLSPTSAERFLFTPSDSPCIDICETWRGGKNNLINYSRRKHIGYVVQTGGLLPFLNVRENIELSRKLLRLPDDGTVVKLAKKLDIHLHLCKLPAQLSAGERQRVAIARALAHQPQVVIADEPTASVDPVTAKSLMKLLCGLADEYNTTAIIATHEWELVDQLGLRRILSTQANDKSKILSIFSG